MKFIDYTEIHAHAGCGGDGIATFRTARNRPKLGPDGGNGGNGGDVYLVAHKGLNTLSSLRYRQVYRAHNGVKGGTNNKTGACGKDHLIPVPCGTIAYEESSGRQIGELIDNGAKLLIAKGGKRGYGNLQFVSSTNRAPRTFTHGKKGEHSTIRLELKLLADVGLAGFPNAGKSTLLSKMSAAKPKVADYPFTTLTPQLGVVEIDGDHNRSSFVMADVPGLLKGASQGKGLGLEFLRHLERTKIIAFVLDSFESTSGSPLGDFKALKSELLQFNSLMAEKSFLVVLNKVDLVHGMDLDLFNKHKNELMELGLPVLEVSGVSGHGLSQLKNKIFDLYHESINLHEENAEILTSSIEECHSSI